MVNKGNSKPTKMQLVWSQNKVTGLLTLMLIVGVVTFFVAVDPGKIQLGQYGIHGNESDASLVLATPVIYTQKNQSVGIRIDDSSAIIRYTLDGTEPTINSDVYFTPILVGKNVVVVKAKAFKSGYLPSATATMTFNSSN